MTIPTREHISHSTIIACPDETQRLSAALTLASALVCQKQEDVPCMSCRQCKLTAQHINPDVIELSRLTDDKGKPRRELYVDQIRAMAADVWVRPGEARRKVYIIKDAIYMNPAAQNAALKLLEEPPGYAAFILCVDSAQRLLPTIVSRCAVLRPMGQETIPESPEAREYLSIARRGDAGELCAFCCRCESMDSEALGVMLCALRAQLCGIIAENSPSLSRPHALRLLDLCQRAMEYQRMNVSVKHILGLLCVLTP